MSKNSLPVLLWWKRIKEERREGEGMREVEMGCGRDTVIGTGRDKRSIRSFVIAGVSPNLN